MNVNCTTDLSVSYGNNGLCSFGAYKCKSLLRYRHKCGTNYFPMDHSTRAYLHGGGGPQVGGVTCGGLPRLSCKRDQIKIRDHMDRRVTPLKRVTSPTWGPPPPCKQVLKVISNWLSNQFFVSDM